MLPYRVALILLLSVCVLGVKSQTLIMNEVSQGESGGQEYVEFVVVDSTAVYNCTGSDPPCIDIRVGLLMTTVDIMAQQELPAVPVAFLMIYCGRVFR